MINWPKTIQLLPLATTLVRSKFCRYNISGFVEELPQLPESRYEHSCAALPSTGVRLGLDQPLKHFQAFVVAGGYNGSNYLSSVLTLLPGATAWTPLASLPRPLYGAQASIVGGRIRVTGGYDGRGGSRRSEVMSFHLKVTL